MVSCCSICHIQYTCTGGTGEGRRGARDGRRPGEGRRWELVGWEETWEREEGGEGK